MSHHLRKYCHNLFCFKRLIILIRLQCHHCQCKAAKLVEGADRLYHETTYAHAEHKIARERGHSTTVEAARIALKAGAGRLVIGHYSSRYKEESVLVEEARTVFPDTHPATEGTTFTIEKRQQP